MSSVRVAFVALSTPSSVSSWSGIPYFALKELQLRFSDLHVIDTPWLDGCLDGLTGAVRFGLMPMREPIVTWLFERILRRTLHQLQPNIVISVGAAHKVSRIGLEWPLIHVSDGMFSTVVNYYPKYLALTSRTLTNGKRVQSDLVRKASAIAFASRWAAEDAMRDFPEAVSRMHVVPFGANLETEPVTRQPKGNEETLKLLFVGYDWRRKGGEIVMAVFRELRRRIGDVQLHIAGCTPRETSGVEGIVCHGILRKDVAAERETLQRLFEESSFLFVPSRHETYGVVFCEACAFGLPAIAAATGGIPTIIKDGFNGFLFPLDAPVEAYVDRILACWRDRDGYQRLQRNARRDFEERLNWHAWGAAVERLVLSALPLEPSAGRPNMVVGSRL